MKIEADHQKKVRARCAKAHYEAKMNVMEVNELMNGSRRSIMVKIAERNASKTRKNMFVAEEA